MADVSVYKRCTMSYAYAGTWIHAGEVRLGTDAAPAANPQWWVAITDADMTSGRKGVHDNG